MSDDNNMGERDLNESAQIKTTEVQPYELGVADGTALVEAHLDEIVPVTGELAEENEQMMEDMGIHPSWFSKLREKAEEFKDRILPKNIDYKKVASVGLAVSMAGSLITACSATPVDADSGPDTSATDTLSAKAEESQVGSTSNTGVEEVPTENMYPTPAVEEVKSPVPEPQATEMEENYYVDFSITPEEWNQFFDGNDNYFIVLRSLQENKDRYYQYQVWLDGNETGSRLVGDRAYFSELEGQSMLFMMDSLENKLKLNDGDLELKVFDKVMESQLFVPREYLTAEIKNVRATVVHMKLEGNKYVYDFLGEGGGVYVHDGEVEIIESGELPDYLPQEVKEKFKEYKRVDLNGDVAEGSGLRNSE